MILEEFLKTSATDLLQGSWLIVGIAMVAGFLACAICPFTLPVGLGVAGVVGTAESRSRGTGLGIALSFFGGLVAALTALGALAGLLGVIATQTFGRYWTLGMALLALAAALLVFWWPLLPPLTRFQRPGLGAAFFYGLVFSLGTPAASLVLLLMIAAAQHRPEYGTILGLGYGLGRGLPFLLIGLFSGAVTRLACQPSWARAVQLTSGCLLLVISGYHLWIFMSLS